MAKDGAKARMVATVSDRALIIRTPTRGSSAHGGTRPQRARLNTRPPAPESTEVDIRTIGTGSVGATL